ncbi:hypothetical protein HNP49_000967 [Pseudomonas fluvialis]|uniref:DUF4124 domain-containing protein n=1 Tax=Pseudomonas fluvialis TaxID=1793966 RepID=A0A7X0ER03_9PSED|nr:DUF4124 domain-containing protein [Pseudomonas fluvialis]MBB6340817.1 hypothetical protein [Pseudomonas fluvialis]
MTRLSALPLLLLLSAVPSLAGAAELYRYVNDRGVTVLDRLGVPPQFISKGYEVLNEQGRVVKVVPPAPSEAERQRLAEEKEKADSDAQLLRLYSTPDDVERARARKLEEIDGQTSVAKANQQSLRTQQAAFQAQAADIERAGRQVPEHLLVQIDNLRAEQANLDKEIQRYAEMRKQIDASFQADKQRMKYLLERQQ